MIQFDLTPYSINPVSLVVIGLTSGFYLLRLKEKSLTSRLMIFRLACFTTSMAAMLLSSVVLWGSALSPLVDALSVVCMASMVCR